MTSFTFCNSSSQRQILDAMKQLVALINQSRWIIEAYVSDFYTHSHWQKLTKSVQEFIDATDPPDWAWLLAQSPNDAPKSFKKVVPLSLLALKCCSQNLSLERKAVDLDQNETIQDLIDIFQDDLPSKKTCLHNQPPSSVTNEKSFMSASPCQTPNYKNGQCMDMQHIFRKHVKPKKQHEIQQLGKVIEILSKTTNCKCVIDVGAGLGHLSRLLTFSHGLKVTTIEATDGHAPRAAELDRGLKRDVVKKLNKQRQLAEDEKTVLSESSIHPTNESSPLSSSIQNQSNTTEKHVEKLLQERLQENLPSHVVGFIQPDIAASQFLEVITKAKCEDETIQETPSEDHFILAGLHTCGDLAPTLLKVFLNCPSAVALASVGCCYMKISACLDDERPSSDCKNLQNYPLSTFLRRQENYSLNYECREMACHFADAYYERLKSNPVQLRIHSYRAALQYLVKTVSPDFESGQVRLISKKGAQVSFPEYAIEMFKKLKLDSKSVADSLMQECEEMTLHWKRVVAFYTIRLSLAPAVETLILLDRMTFLRECGMNSALLPIFDSRLSPRNFVLLALRLRQY